MGKFEIGDTVNGHIIKVKGEEIWLNDADVNFFKAAVAAGVRHDWHEPDEEGLTATVVGKHFDNAGCGDEQHVILKKDDKEIGRVNLATLCALATELMRRTKAVK